MWRAFWDLDSERQQIQMSRALPDGQVLHWTRKGPLPWRAIDAYARRNGFEGAEFDLLHDCLSEMDGEYQAWLAEREQEAG